MDRLKKRSDFKAAAKGRRVARAAFVMQAAPTPKLSAPGAADGPRFGFTVTRQLGKAVLRNRIRRRLKEAVRLGAAAVARPGTDYVLIGRGEALRRPFDRLVAEIVDGIEAAGRAAKPARAGAALRQGEGGPRQGAEITGRAKA